MRCRGVQGIAEPAYLEGFLFSGLLGVAPYCVPGGVSVVSIEPMLLHDSARSEHAPKVCLAPRRARFAAAFPRLPLALDTYNGPPRRWYGRSLGNRPYCSRTSVLMRARGLLSGVVGAVWGGGA